MSRCIILGAGASFGYDDSLPKSAKPPLTNDLFTNGESLGLFTPQKYPRLYSLWASYKTGNIDVEDFMQKLVIGFQAKQENSMHFQKALGESWYYIFEIFRYYLKSYQSNGNNYDKLARHFRSSNYSIISLNYDTLFELAVLKAGGMYDYESVFPDTIP